MYGKRTGKKAGKKGQAMTGPKNARNDKRGNVASENSV